MKTKKCTKCGEKLPETAEYFNRNSGGHKGLRNECKVCRKKYRQSKRGRASAKKYRTSGKGKATQRKACLKRRYNITIEEYDEFFERQMGCCAVCNKPETTFDSKFNVIRRLHVDHDHETGRVRGLLCRKCNLIIGHADDDLERLLSAALYLEKNNE